MGLTKRFLAWKDKLDKKPNLEKDRNGRFVDKGVMREWAAYVRSVEDNLPKQPPLNVLEAMIRNGVRPDWAASIYQLMRKELLK